MSEPSAGMLAALGARVVDPANEDAAALHSLTDGEGVDVAVDAAGAGAAFTTAVAGLVPGGRLVVAALHERSTDFQPTQLTMNETEIVGLVGYRPEEIGAVIAAMADGFYEHHRLGAGDAPGAHRPSPPRPALRHRRQDPPEPRRGRRGGVRGSAERAGSAGRTDAGERAVA